jgi:hypothetical protein
MAPENHYDSQRHFLLLEGSMADRDRAIAELLERGFRVREDDQRIEKLDQLASEFSRAAHDVNNLLSGILVTLEDVISESEIDHFRSSCQQVSRGFKDLVDRLRDFVDLREAG